MTLVRAIFAVLRFELIRTFTVSRLGAWLVMSLFPPTLIMLILYRQDPPAMDLQFGFPLFLLIPQVTILLGMLLWASPIVHTELEGRTWTYLVVRPRGRTVMLLGKYLSAVIWSAASAVLALTLVTFVCMYHQMLDEPIRFWLMFFRLILLSSLVYGATFVLLGTMFHRRAMVMCVAFAFLWEFTITMVPAVIQEFTFAFHLRGLMIHWTNWGVPGDFEHLFSHHSVTQHITFLLLATFVLLVIADGVLHKREFITAAEA